MKKRIPIFEAIAIIVATAIGAGVLGVPYVFSLGNFYTSSIILIVVALGMVLTMLFLGEIALRTKGIHQVVGYVGIYLGKRSKIFQAFVLVFSIYGALLAYTIGQGEVLSFLLGGSPFFWVVVFYLFFSLLLYKGISMIKHVEFVLTIVIFFALVAMGFLTVGDVNLNNVAGWGGEHLLLSYGVLLFACYGLVSVPHAREILGVAKREKSAAFVIVVGTLLPAFLYLIFAFFVVGITGQQTTEIATIGLGEKIGPPIVVLGSLFAFFAMATSFISLGLSLRDIFQRDLGISFRSSNFLVIVIPLIFYFLVIPGFVSVLGFVGAIGPGLIGIFLIMTYWQARKKGSRKPEFVIPNAVAIPTSFFLFCMYMLGIVYTFL